VSGRWRNIAYLIPLLAACGGTAGGKSDDAAQDGDGGALAGGMRSPAPAAGTMPGGGPDGGSSAPATDARSPTDTPGALEARSASDVSSATDVTGVTGVTDMRDPPDTSIPPDTRIAAPPADAAATVDGASTTDVPPQPSGMCLFPAPTLGAVIEVAPTGALDTLSNPFTMEAWVKRLQGPTTGWHGTIFSRKQFRAIWSAQTKSNAMFEYRLDPTQGLVLNIMTDALQPWPIRNQIYPEAVNARDGWHHTALICQVNVCRMYVDGRFAGDAAEGTGIAPFVGPWMFGARGDDPSPRVLERVLFAAIREVRISNIVRYNTDFAPATRFEVDGNTIGLWHIDEGTGTSIRNVATAGNDGLVRAGVWKPCDAPL
jgi:hypothetical protein